MKLRFDVDQAAAFAAGIDAPNSFHIIDVDPGTLDPADRRLIADRLRGIDLFPRQHVVSPPGTSPRITALTPTLDGLLTAVRQDARHGYAA